MIINVPFFAVIGVAKWAHMMISITSICTINALSSMLLAKTVEGYVG